MQKTLTEALKVLQNGGVILYPTDTVWGIGCDATNPEAVRKIHKIKGSNDNKSMIVLLENINLIHFFVNKVPDVAYQLIKVTTQPLTIVYPGAKELAENLIAHDGSIGIRITQDEFCIRLLNKFKIPVVSTSANFAGKPAPENFDSIPAEIKNQVDYIVNWRQNEKTKNKPSEIIKVDELGRITIIRK